MEFRTPLFHETKLTRTCPNRTLINFPIVKECLKTYLPEENLIDSSSPQYKVLNYQWNMLNYKNPALIILVRHVSDIQNTVRCASRSNYPIAIKSGGHSYEKYSFGNKDSLVIDLKLLDKIDVDVATRMGVIEAGALLGKVYAGLWKAGKFGVPAGSCPTVGIAGHTLGGGFGFSSRKYGLMIDNVVEFEMVDANGDLLVVNQKENSDLFWALRGAGFGSFGVVTKFKFKLFDASNPVRIINLKYRNEFKHAFESFQRWTLSKPDSSVTAVMFTNSELFVSINFVISSNGNRTLTDALTSEIKNLFLTNSSIYSQKDVSFIEMVLEFSSMKNIKNIKDLENVSREMNSEPMYISAKAHFVKREISSAQVETLEKNIRNFTTGYVLFDSFGGNIDNVNPEDTAFIHRKDILYGIQVVHASYEVTELTLINDFDRNTSFMHSNQSFQNYIDEKIERPLVKYYGLALQKLMVIKNRYDIDNFFCFPLSIPPFRFH